MGGERTSKSLSSLPMQTKDYTPDAICRSLGLGDFDEGRPRGKAHRSLRLLLCPSFDPEVCITFEDVDGRLACQGAVARTQIWTLASPGLVTTDRTEHSLGQAGFEDVAGRFRNTLAQPGEAVVILDGMQVHACLREYGRVVTVTDNPAKNSPLSTFLADIIRDSFHASADHVLRSFDSNRRAKPQKAP